MESFATGYNVPTQMAQSDTNLQAAQLQKQYMPEQARLDMVQKQQATALQGMQMGELADKIKGEKEIAPQLQQYLQTHPDAKEEEVSTQMAKLLFDKGRVKDALGYMNAATKAKHEDTIAKLDEGKLAQVKSDLIQNAISGLDTSSQEGWDRSLLGAVSSIPGASANNLNALVAKNIQAGMSPEDARKSAVKIATEMVKTSKQRNEEAQIKIKQEIADATAKRLENQTLSMMNSIRSAEARAIIGERRLDQADTKQAAAEKEKERLLFSDKRNAFNKLHANYLKERAAEPDVDKKIALDAQYQTDLESKNDEFKEEFGRRGIPYTDMGTPGTSIPKTTVAPTKAPSTSPRPVDAPIDAKQAPDGFWYSKNAAGKFVKWGDSKESSKSAVPTPKKEDPTPYKKPDWQVEAERTASLDPKQASKGLREEQLSGLESLLYQPLGGGIYMKGSTKYKKVDGKMVPL